MMLLRRARSEQLHALDDFHQTLAAPAQFAARSRHLHAQRLGAIEYRRAWFGGCVETVNVQLETHARRFFTRFMPAIISTGRMTWERDFSLGRRCSRDESHSSGINSVVIKNGPVEHHGLFLPQIRNRFQRRVLSEDETTQVPGRELAEIFLVAQTAGTGAGGGVEDGQWQQSRALHQFQFVKKSE